MTTKVKIINDDESGHNVLVERKVNNELILVGKLQKGQELDAYIWFDAPLIITETYEVK